MTSYGGFRKSGAFLGSPYNKDHTILRCILLWPPVYGSLHIPKTAIGSNTSNGIGNYEGLHVCRVYDCGSWSRS